MWGAGDFWSKFTVAACVILIANFSTFAYAAPDSEYWRAPYALRVTSNDTRFSQGLLCKSKYGGFQLLRNGNARNAWPLYPAISPFVPDPSPNTSVSVGNLYQDQYHSKTNSTELVLIWSSRPGSADFSPMFRLSWDTGPGILHVWPALYIVMWGGWRFKWNESKTKMLLDDALSNRQKWWWIAYQESGDWWSLATWNGTTPAKNTGWSPDIYDIIDRHVKVEVEVVPLWTLLPSDATT